MKAEPSPLAEGIARVHDEAAGVLSVHVVRVSDAPGLICAAVSGNERAAQLVVQVNDLLHRIGAAPANSPMQCGCCGSDLRPGRFAFAIATPDIADPSAGLGMAICRRCGTSLGAITAAAVRALQLIWPNARPVTIHGATGHA